MKEKILIVISSSYDLYMITAVLNYKLKRLYSIALLPTKIYDSLPDEIKSLYNSCKSYDSDLKNLLSLKSIFNTINLINICRDLKKKNTFSKIYFGAYRDTVTSLVTKQFKNQAKFIAIKQGIDMPEIKFRSFNSIKTIHNKIYFLLFGYSGFKSQKIKSKNYQNDNLLSRNIWINNPFELDNVYTIGANSVNYSDNHKFIYPKTKYLKNKYSKYKYSNDILLIGERTPISISWSKSDYIKLKKIFYLIKKQTNNCKIFLRPRAKLTNNDFYSFLNPIILDPYQLYDDQLLKLKPKLVISIKSTASKVASYYGFKSILLYKIFELNKNERIHLDYLFADGAPLKFIENINQFKKEINMIG